MDEIIKTIQYAIKEEKPIFETVCLGIETKCEKSATNIAEFKQKSTTSKGNAFEDFCILYLAANGIGSVRTKDADQSLLKYFNLVKVDRGIDLIASQEFIGSDGLKTTFWYAVQCKYRKRIKTGKVINLQGGKQKRLTNSVTWEDLSTFYALADRTGPWVKHIVMTNCDYVNRYGRKSEKDHTIAFGTFNSMDKKLWEHLIPKTIGHKLSESVEPQKQLSREEIREKRLLALNVKV